MHNVFGLDGETVEGLTALLGAAQRAEAYVRRAEENRNGGGGGGGAAYVRHTNPHQQMAEMPD